MRAHRKKKNYHKSLASRVRLGNRACGERREMDSGTAGQLSLEPTPTQHPTPEKVYNTRTVARSYLAIKSPPLEPDSEEKSFPGLSIFKR